RYAPVPLSIGNRLGSYQITAFIGKGGMGEVYRAHDGKLNRDVALKVLPDLLAQDPERRARFEREAQLLAALNHPNIAGIYGLEESGTTCALVMELVEGPTLEDKLAQGPAKAGRYDSQVNVGRDARGGLGVASAFRRTFAGLPLDEALPIARQIADALQ